MNRQEVLTFDHMMAVRDQHNEICDKATELFESYIETQKFNHWNYQHMRDAFDDGVYAASYDSETVYFEHSRGYYQEEDAVIMPLAFVYSLEYRDRLVAECKVKVAENEAKTKANKERLASVQYQNKLAEFEKLKKELGK